MTQVRLLFIVKVNSRLSWNREIFSCLC